MAIESPHQHFDEVEWLRKHFTMEINLHKMEKVLLFSLMWNLFESEACNCNASVGAITTVVNEVDAEGHLRRQDFADHLAYFQNRYFPGGAISTMFESLNFRPSDNRILVERALKGDLSNVKDIVTGLMIIVYRFRNNLFHGEKNIPNLDLQNENFRQANSLLACFLDALKQSREAH